jgi:8-oxo-dGTP diphosphatase
MNAFESGERKVIPAVLIYVRDADRVLMIHRNGRPGDYHSGKWNGLGGKCEIDESPLQAAQRELREESGLSIDESAFRSLGVIQFPNFKAHKNEDWMVFVFVVQAPGLSRKPESVIAGDEGTLHWVPVQDLLSLNLWAGDREFIPLVMDEKPFVGTIWYQGQDVIRHWIQPLK